MTLKMKDLRPPINFMDQYLGNKTTFAPFNADMGMMQTSIFVLLMQLYAQVETICDQHCECNAFRKETI